MKKYQISKQFFPFSYLIPPVNKAFLNLVVPFMKAPKFFYRDKGVSVTRYDVVSYDGEKLPCLLMSPKGVDEKLPCLIYIHGGGFVFEAAKYHYSNALRYVKEIGCRVFFVNYRLAPKHVHPVFFEDCYAAFCWAYDNADKLNIDPSRIGIGGDSAGATLSVGVCMMAKDRQHPAEFAFQMLTYPFLDARGESESNRRYTDTPMWNSSLSAKLLPMMSLDYSSPSYVYFSPVEAKSFEGLPPAYIETAEFDCLHDDGILYAEKLREAGIHVVLNETRGTMHGFDIMENAPTSKAAMSERIKFMNAAFYNLK